MKEVSDWGKTEISEYVRGEFGCGDWSVGTGMVPGCIEIVNMYDTGGGL